MMNEEEVIESLSALGQDHLFDCWTDWDEHKKSILLEELVSLDLRLLSSLQKCLLEKEVPPSLSPIPHLSHDDIIKMEKERELGRELISRGKAAFLTVAGGQGSIAVHIFNVAFLAQTDCVLPFHQACKKEVALIPGSNGCILKEAEVVKFEKFIFDIIPLAGKAVFYETLRADEFAPLKNKSGVDSIATCARGYIEKYALWLEECGVQVPRDQEGRSIYPVEISPLYALDKEILKKKLPYTVNRIDDQVLFV